MRLLIDATALLVQSAGVKNYLYHWLVHLRRLRGGEQVQAFPFLNRFSSLDHERSLVGRTGTWSRLGLVTLLNWTSSTPLDFLVSGVDLFHTSSLLRNPPRRSRLTATVQDLTCWTVPELQKPANVRADRRFAEATLSRADGLIAASEHTRQDMIRILGIRPEKIEVIYHGVPEEYFQAKPNPGRPYLLCLGTIEPRKNIDRLLDAYHALPASLREEFDLVLAGPIGWADPATIARVRGSGPGVRYAGYIPESELPGLTASATALVCPSLYEGFGFPVAQAMAAGVPVVTSNVSSLPEITAGAAVLVDPLSVSEITAALARILTSPSLREELSRLGRIQARQFRWEDNAKKSVRFFEKVIGA